MTIDILNKLKALDINLKLVGESIDIEAPEGVMTADLLNEIKVNKNEIVEFLASHQGSRKAHMQILPAPKQASYPLSSSQKRIWLLEQFDNRGAAHNLHDAFIFEGTIEIEILNESFRHLIRRHEILRTIFKTDGKGEVRQWIEPADNLDFKLTVEDFSNRQDAERIIKEILSVEFMKPFNLQTGPLMKVLFLKISRERYIFAYVMHHIIADGWSMHLLLQELVLLYNASVKKLPNPLRPIRIQYKDYACWQELQMSQSESNSTRNYWINQFTGEIPVLDMFTDYQRPVTRTYNGNKIWMDMDKNMSTQFRSLMQNSNCTVFMGLLSVVNILLNKYSNQTDIIIGTPVSGREHIDLNDQIGYYVNTLALRTRLDRADSFTKLLAKVKDVTLNAFEHQSYPFENLLSDLKIKRDSGRNPLFDVFVIMQNTDVINFSHGESFLNGISVSKYEQSTSQGSKFDLSFEFKEEETGIVIGLEYNTDLFTAESAKRILAHFSQTVSCIVSDSHRSIQDIEIVDETEKDLLINKFKGKAATGFDNASVIELFEEQVLKNPDNTALIHAGGHFSYRLLNEKANQLAAHLASTVRSKSDDLIGIKLNRCPDMIISIIAVLKSGAAYVPLDPANPGSCTYLQSSSDCKLIIDEDYIRRFNQISSKYDRVNLDIKVKAQDLFCVIFTSGSTGTPKGCLLENRGVLNHLLSKKDLLNVSAEFSLVHNSALHFVGGIWQLWLPLITGGTSILSSSDELKNFPAMLSMCNSYGISVVEVIPSQLNEYLLNNLPIPWGCVKTIILTGEKLTPYFVNKCYTSGKDLVIINTYGQTECSDVTTSYVIPHDLKNDKVLIGKPIRNISILILSENGGVCPIGVPGEIYTVGPGVSRGYLNQNALTKEKFIETSNAPAEKMYRTGDYGRWHADGNIEILDRVDNQVKIRGYRIEIGEIEEALRSIDEIETAVVLTHAEVGSTELIAYILFKKTPLPIIDIRRGLEKKLPEYKIPSRYVSVDSFPLMENGKIDKASLKQQDAVALNSGVLFTGPQNLMQAELIMMWEEILKVDNIGVYDNFFLLGGQSLKVVTLISKIKKTFGIELRFIDLYNNPTIHDLCQLIYAGAKQEDQVIRLNKCDSRLVNMYLIPPLLGSSLLYKPFAQRVEGEINCLGLQMSGIEKGELADKSVHEIANRFLNAILRIQDNNEFIIAGYSFGVLVAFELAKLLEGLKINRFKLVFVDLAVEKHRYLTTKESQQEFITQSMEFYRHYLDEEQLFRYREIVQSNFQSMESYVPDGRVNSDILAIEATRDTKNMRMIEWQSCTNGVVKVQKIASDHKSIFQPENTPCLSQMILSHIKALKQERPLTV